VRRNPGAHIHHSPKPVSLHVKGLQGDWPLGILGMDQEPPDPPPHSKQPGDSSWPWSNSRWANRPGHPLPRCSPEARTGPALLPTGQHQKPSNKGDVCWGRQLESPGRRFPGSPAFRALPAKQRERRSDYTRAAIGRPQPSWKAELLRRARHNPRRDQLPGLVLAGDPPANSALDPLTVLPTTDNNRTLPDERRRPEVGRAPKRRWPLQPAPLSPLEHAWTSEASKALPRRLDSVRSGSTPRWCTSSRDRQHL